MSGCLYMVFPTASMASRLVPQEFGASQVLDEAKTGLWPQTHGFIMVQVSVNHDLCRYANPGQTAQGLHMRIYARAFIFAEEANPRCSAGAGLHRQLYSTYACVGIDQAPTTRQNQLSESS